MSFLNSFAGLIPEQDPVKTCKNALALPDFAIVESLRKA